MSVFLILSLRRRSSFVWNVEFTCVLHELKPSEINWRVFIKSVKTHFLTPCFRFVSDYLFTLLPITGVFSLVYDGILVMCRKDTFRWPSRTVIRDCSSSTYERGSNSEGGNSRERATIWWPYMDSFFLPPKEMVPEGSLCSLGVQRLRRVFYVVFREGNGQSWCPCPW